MADFWKINLYEVIDLSFKLFGIAVIITGFFQLIEVKRKRLIDMYWKIHDMYSSDIQRLARKDVHEFRLKYAEKIHLLMNKENLDFYNTEYHNAAEATDNKRIDKSIINRIRLINQIGVLLKKKHIDQDMLFGLIGAGFEEDYLILQSVLAAHRYFHNQPLMYPHFEISWSLYQEWIKKMSE